MDALLIAEIRLFLFLQNHGPKCFLLGLNTINSIALCDNSGPYRDLLIPEEMI
jgi:hypothetical protein